VYVSAVSRELSAAREMVANCLRVFHNVDVAEQPEFGTESGTLLGMLERRVNRSIGVLQLVGSAYGFAPRDRHPRFGQIRGIMRFRAGLRNAAADFEKAIKSCNEDIEKFVNFDPLDTRAFAHAGLAMLGRRGHEELAVQDYRRARELAPARGIVDIGRTVFSCFGSTPQVRHMEQRLFGG
jgi:hypothetical protein